MSADPARKRADAHVAIAFGALIVGAHDAARLREHLPWRDVLGGVATTCLAVSLVALFVSASFGVCARAWIGVRERRGDGAAVPLTVLTSLSALGLATHAAAWFCQTVFASLLVKRVGTSLSVAAIAALLLLVHTPLQRLFDKLAPARAHQVFRALALLAGGVVAWLVGRAIVGAAPALVAAFAFVTLLGVWFTLRSPIEWLRERAPGVARKLRIAGGGLWLGYVALAAWFVTSGGSPHLDVPSHAATVTHPLLVGPNR